MKLKKPENDCPRKSKEFKGIMNLLSLLVILSTFFVFSQPAINSLAGSLPIPDQQSQETSEYRVYLPQINKEPITRVDRQPPFLPPPGKKYDGMGQFLTTVNGVDYYEDEIKPCIDGVAELSGNYPEVISDYASPNNSIAKFENFRTISQEAGRDYILIEGMDVNLETLFDGGYNNQLIDIGKYLKHSNIKVYIRPLYELSVGGAGWPILYEFWLSHPEFETPSEIGVKAYKMIVDKVEEGAGGRMDNVAWILHLMPRKEDVNNPWVIDHLNKFWPGSEYVDYLGVSIFGDEHLEAMPEFMAWAAEKGKPVVVPEFGYGINTKGVFDPLFFNFINKAFNLFAAYDQIKMFSVICNDMARMQSDPNWPNMWLLAKLEALIAYASKVENPIFNNEP